MSIENPNGARILKLVKRHGVLRLWMLRNLPMAFLSSLRVKELTPVHATVSVPYNFINKNPFRSTYFAVLAMAAELSTGILSLYHTTGYSPSISMLVANIEATFEKKATGVTYFSCHDGEKIGIAVQKTIETGDSTTASALTIGRDKDGIEIARFIVTWSFKQRSKK